MDERFCIAVCQAHCCKHGKLNVPIVDARRIAGRQWKRLVREALLLEEWDASWTFTLPCPRLKADRCTIYAKRPRACRAFPLIRFGKRVFQAPSCPGPCEEELLALEKEGYERLR